MNVEIAFSGSVKSLEALVRFLKHLEGLVPRPVSTQEENWQAGEKMAQVGADIIEDTDVLVVLAPYTVKATGQ